MHSRWHRPGSDYSQASIDLAKAVAKRRGVTGVRWIVGDVLQSSVSDRYGSFARVMTRATQDASLALEALSCTGMAWQFLLGQSFRGQRYVRSLLSLLCLCRYSVVTDKGTFDAIGLSEDGQSKQALYIRRVHSLLQPGGLLIITSCNSTLQELVSLFAGPSKAAETASDTVTFDHEARSASSPSSVGVSRACTVPASSGHGDCGGVRQELKRKHFTDASELSSASRVDPDQHPTWVYADHVRTYQVFSFGGYEGSKVCTVAFRRAANSGCR